VSLDAEAGPVRHERLHLLCQVACHDGHARQPGRRELAEEDGDDRAPVDREDGLCPPLGERPQTTALAGRHDDNVHQRCSEV
jgi:hypothetical protein